MTVSAGKVIEHLLSFKLERPGADCESPGSGQTAVGSVAAGEENVPRFVNEFWTARQRQAASIHEVSYRACFKAQLPRFFIDLLTAPGDTVYDPFSGRGTTVIEAALMRRKVISNDVNPLSAVLAAPRLAIPSMEEVGDRLEQIPLNGCARNELDLSMFYHPRTESEILSLKDYLCGRLLEGSEDGVDRWIRMVATNRLTGHSSGFFSVYTLPPNQAVSAASQIKINRRRNQEPDYRHTGRIIMRKSRRLLNRLDPAGLENLREAAGSAIFLQNAAAATPEIADSSVDLTVTSPPFLDQVQYAVDNWLRCWFNGIDGAAVEREITGCRRLEDWTAAMGRVFGELYRITRPGGWVAFEVGEVKKGRVNLDEHVVPLGIEAGFTCPGVVVNSQAFTKTANIWGVDNNRLGTNSNRIVLFHRD